jgi:dihydrofolate reductase
MPHPFVIEGYAIVSADGMIADRFGVMPDALKIDADQRFFLSSLDRAGFLAHGRHSQEPDSRAAERHRLILTRRVPAIVPDPLNPKAVLWNPAGASLETAWQALGAPEGPLAVIGGTEVFGLFLAVGYDEFYLSRAPKISLPGGRPVFPQAGNRAPEEVLADAGLEPGPVRLLDAASGASVWPWRRAEERRTIAPASSAPRSSVPSSRARAGVVRKKAECRANFP